MTRAELLSEIRERIGNPAVNTVTRDQLERYLESALNWLANRLRYRVRTEPQMLGLVAEQQEYPLPGDLMWLLWLEWNGTRLTPASTAAWQASRTDWRGATPANLSEYAIEGRTLILFPSASEGAVETDPFLVARYIAAPEGLTPGGLPGLSDSDQWLAVWRASWEYLTVHPSEENLARANSYVTIIQDLLDDARRRMQNPHDRQHVPRFRYRNPRYGAAR